MTLKQATQQFAALPVGRQASKRRDTVVGICLALFGAALAAGGFFVLKANVVVYVGVGVVVLGATVADKEAVTAALGSLVDAIKAIRTPKG